MIGFPTPPHFDTVEEADAWLEEHPPPTRVVYDSDDHIIYTATAYTNQTIDIQWDTPTITTIK